MDDPLHKQMHNARPRPEGGPRPRGGPDDDLSDVDIDELLEDSDNESMIHRFDFGLKSPSSAPGRPAQPLPPLDDLLPGSEIVPAAPSPEASAPEGFEDPDVEPIFDVLDLEDRVDHAFTAGASFHPAAPTAEAAAPEATEAEIVEPTQIDPSAAPRPEDDEPTQQTLLGVPAPEPRPAVEAPTRGRPRGPRKPRAVSSGTMPKILGAALVVLVLLTLAVVVVLVTQEADTGLAETETPAAEAEPPSLDPGALDAGPVEQQPGIEVVGLEIVADEPPPQPAPVGTPEAKLVLGAGGEPIGNLEVKRTWQPLLTGPDLPGWQTRNREAWSFQNGVLTLRGVDDPKPASVLVTTQSYRDLAFTLKARPADNRTTFGLLARAQSGGAVRLEFVAGRGTLRAGEKVAPLNWEWKPQEWHQVALIADEGDVLIYVDRRKVASLSDVAIDSDGRLGIYCTSGSAAFRTVFVQRLD